MNISNAIYQMVTELQGLIAIDGTHRDNIPGIVDNELCSIRRHVSIDGNLRRAHYVATLPGLATITSFQNTPVYETETLNHIQVISAESTTAFKRDVVTSSFSIDADRTIYSRDFCNAVLSAFPPTGNLQNQILHEMLNHIHAAASRPLWADSPVEGIFTNESIVADLYLELDRKSSAYDKIAALLSADRADALYRRSIEAVYLMAMDAIGDNRYHYMGGGYPREAVNSNGDFSYTRGNRHLSARSGTFLFDCFLFGVHTRAVEGWGNATRWLESGWIADTDQVRHVL